MTSSRLLNLAALGFLLVVIVTIFRQIETDLKEQGIASGGPYDNAATYPRIVASFMGILLLVQLVTELVRKGDTSDASEVELSDLRRAGMLIVVFAVYLMSLTTLGYHLATTPMIFAIMWICGMRQYLNMAIASLGIATVFAFFFEVFLNVVLPLGIWNIFIPW
ncbi:tripartite tricarboxylate transporter TctB family protein [Ruegeria lacuscaerulensis]|uniref:tripartite tricarboxylate transporter TctB family protein n=1 Tax=Ruegeria lacuscaerulensis TaxID=55218 RepID=UPI00147E8E31|nr:tripartite tricarboxylate transporter TctB family protein [Ruegeria lacuscaerulensis]